MSDVWESGRLTAVYHPVGTRSDGELRLKRANYDVLEWQGPGATRTSTYVVPLGFERVTDSDLEDYIHSDARDAIEVGQEFGFYQKGVAIVEPHQADGSDSWVGLQFFGHI